MLGAASPAPCQTLGETPSQASRVTAAQATVWPPVRAPAPRLALGATWIQALAETLQVEVEATATLTQTVDVPHPARAQALGR